MSATYIRSVLIASLLLLFLSALAGQAQPTGCYDLAVLAFEDLNADGAFGLGPAGLEPVMAGVKIRLYQDLPPRQLFGQEDLWLVSGQTNEDGYIVFRCLSTGYYFVTGISPQGYLPTTPLVQSAPLDGEAQGAVLEYFFGQLPHSAIVQTLYFPAMRLP